MKPYATALLIGSSFTTLPCNAFVVGPAANSISVIENAQSFHQQPWYRLVTSLASSKDGTSAVVVEEGKDRIVEAVPILSSVTDPEAIRLRNELMDLAEATDKGFSSTPSQKKRAREIIMELAKFNPTAEPAAPYYSSSKVTGNANTTAADDDDRQQTPVVSLAGKWNLIYTDAPDITSLDTSRNPFATAKLGRIGQECIPPSIIKNVIEWRRPDWADLFPLPFAGDAESRILQKVCTKATASPDKPKKVNLEVAGIELVAPPLPGTGTSNNSKSNGKLALQEAIENEGLAVGILRNNPLELRGPLTAPFGQFEILYLDEEMRITRTGQNYVAVNVRSKDEWF